MELSHQQPLPEPVRPHAENDWDRFTRSVLLFALRCRNERPSVFSLEDLGGLGLAPTEARGRSVIVNAFAYVASAQRAVDHVRELLGREGIRELGFGTTRTVPSPAPLCPSEGWALVIDSGNMRLLEALLQLVLAREPDPYEPPNVRPPPTAEMRQGVFPPPFANPPEDYGTRCRVTDHLVRNKAEISRQEALILLKDAIHDSALAERLWHTCGVAGWFEAERRACGLTERLVAAGLVGPVEVETLRASARVSEGLQPPDGSTADPAGGRTGGG